MNEATLAYAASLTLQSTKAHRKKEIEEERKA
jgi:hypothetical protein